MKKIKVIFILLLCSTSLKAASPDWSINPADYNYSMTVTAVLNVNCVELSHPSNKLGAFVGSDARGSVLSSTIVNDRYIAMLTLYSNQPAGETVSFKIYDAVLDQVIDCKTELIFQDDAVYGTPTFPQVVLSNNAPTALVIDSSNIDENNTAGDTIGTLSVSDIDASDTHSFSLVSGEGSTNNGSFSIVNDVLFINVVTDYEVKQSYSVRVGATDNQGCTVEEILTVSVQPLNDPPTDIILSNDRIAENNTVFQQVGVLTSTDSDEGDTFTYSLVAGTGDTDNSRFAVQGTKLVANEVLDYENSSSYTIRVRTTDSNGGEFEKEFIIYIDDSNETPTNIQLSSLTITENGLINDVVATLTTTDSDTNDAHSYSFVSSSTNDNSYFTISGDELLSNQSFNYELKKKYFIAIQTDDNKGGVYSKQFTILIKDTNDTPTAISLSNSIVDEEQPAGEFVGTFSSTDEDIDDTFTYDLVSGTGSDDNASFAIIANTLETTESFNSNVKNSYSILVRVTDSGGLSITQSFEIDVINVIENSFPSTDYMSPNGDGINDTWSIDNVQKFQDFALSIFNSHGTIVYTIAGNYDNSWGGMYNGQELPTGTYYYVMTDNNDSSKIFKGTISLIR